ncbi:MULTISPECIES: DUF3888 domain-containing protein [unclassified Bacillus (in: firmicutes)]|uniref:DUF3888 domain-containing protein n=1 Tax=unclassified Bacillus (in: firmicutes) TaxID=185979 RepID=UPI0008F15F84|nr:MULTISPECIES: DUF3888 domain-containing protein [unclassified Bacillus (in: firmicutes)]SFH98263.1 Protein of unknown function [Bacillus sp. 71mf]SFS93914.1 Protein of unknown function [Bacillus sp. 103mf]
MKKFVTIIVFALFMFSLTSLVHGEEKKNIQDYFDVNINGYRVYVLDDFVELINEGKVTSLTKIFFETLRREQQWVLEPRVYVKGNLGYVHIVKQNGVNVLYHIKKIHENWTILREEKKVINRVPVPKELLKEVLLERLVEYIGGAVQDYYGEGRLWYRGSEKILSIEKDEAEFEFYVIVQVITFKGAHNPPYGEETMTFRVKGGGEVQLMKYKHRDISETELSKLKLRTI